MNKDKEIEKINQCITELVYDKIALRKAYNYYHGVRDAEQFKHIEENFEEMLTMLKKRVQEKDEEIKKLRNENTKLKEKLSEIAPDLVLEETFKRR